MATYRDEIQQLQRDLYACYQKAGRLRDVATGHEKEYFNKFRGLTDEAYNWMTMLDNNLPESRAIMELK